MRREEFTEQIKRETMKRKGTGVNQGGKGRKRKKMPEPEGVVRHVKMRKLVVEDLMAGPVRMSCKPAFAAKEKKEYKRHPGVTGGRILAHKWLWAEGDKKAHLWMLTRDESIGDRCIGDQWLQGWSVGELEQRLYFQEMLDINYRKLWTEEGKPAKKNSCCSVCLAPNCNSCGAPECSREKVEKYTADTRCEHRSLKLCLSQVEMRGDEAVWADTSETPGVKLQEGKPPGVRLPEGAKWIGRFVEGIDLCGEDGEEATALSEEPAAVKSIKAEACEELEMPAEPEAGTMDDSGDSGLRMDETSFEGENDAADVGYMSPGASLNPETGDFEELPNDVSPEAELNPGTDAFEGLPNDEDEQVVEGPAVLLEAPDQLKEEPEVQDWEEEAARMAPEEMRYAWREQCGAERLCMGMCGRYTTGGQCRDRLALRLLDLEMDCPMGGEYGTCAWRGRNTVAAHFRHLEEHLGWEKSHEFIMRLMPNYVDSSCREMGRQRCPVRGCYRKEDMRGRMMQHLRNEHGRVQLQNEFRDAYPGVGQSIWEKIAYHFWVLRKGEPKEEGHVTVKMGDEWWHDADQDDQILEKGMEQHLEALHGLQAPAEFQAGPRGKIAWTW